jgi:hypothetical protein
MSLNRIAASNVKGSLYKHLQMPNARVILDEMCYLNGLIMMWYAFVQ